MIDKSFLSDLEQQYKLPSGLLYAQMMAESGGDPNAISPKGALGAFQFMPATAQEYGIDPLDPIQAAQGAARMNAQMLDKYGGDIPSAMAAYNWGQGNLDRKGMENAPRETRDYIGRILGALNPVSVANAEELPDDVPEGFVLENNRDPRYDLGSVPWSKEGVETAPIDEDVPEGFVLEEPKKEYFSALGPEFREAATGAGELAASGFEDVSRAVSPLAAIYRMAQGEMPTPEQAKYLEEGSLLSPLVDVGKGLGKGALASLGMVWSPVTAVNKAFVGNPLENVTGIPSEYTDLALSLVEPFAAPKALKAIASTEAGQNALTKVGKYLGADVTGSKVPYAGGITPENIVKETTKVTKTPPKAAISSDAFHQQANQAYQRAEELGGTFPSKYVDDFLTEAGKKAPQTAAGKVISGENEVSKLLERMDALKGKNLSLRESQEIDEALGNLIDKNTDMGRLTKEGKKLWDIQSEFRNAMRKAADDPKLNTEGFKEWKRGQKLWSQQMAMRDIERILAKAELSDQPATMIRNGLRTIITNPSRMRSFTKSEQEAIKKAAKTGVGEELLRAIGSRFAQYAFGGAGFMAGGPVGAVASAAGAHFASNAARKASGKVGEKKIAKVLETIAKR